MDAQHQGGRWGTVAAAVMRRSGLSVAAKAVYSTLATYADQNGWIWAKQQTIAGDLDRSRAWIHAAICELEEQGLLQHERQYIEGRQRASRYRLLDGLSRGALSRGTSPTKGDDQETERLLSEAADSAVEPADTNQDEGFISSLPESERKPPFGRNPMDEARLEIRATDPAEVPADWVPNLNDVAWARLRHPNLDVPRFTESFVLSCRAKGYRYVDVSAAWRRWLTDPKGRLPLVPITSDATARKEISHDRSRQYRPAPDSAGHDALKERNAATADRVLERLLGRRAGHHTAGPSA
jgi:hypothetical protein